MLSLQRLLRFKDLTHSFYQHHFVFTVSRIKYSANSVNQILLFPLDLATKSKSKVYQRKAPVDITQGVLLVVSAVSPPATDWSLDSEVAQCKIRPQDQAAHSIWSLCE